MSENAGSGRISRRRLLTLSSAAAGAIAIGGTGVVTAQDADHEREDVVIESHDGTEIAMTVYRPANATAGTPVPMILHSHGWSGSRTSSDGAFQRELNRGFGVLSFDQRGHGDSGGEAHVQDPELEGRDVIEVLDYVEGLEWVARSDSGEEDGDGDELTPPCENAAVDPPGLECPDTTESDDTDDTDDPMVFAIGGSYGGGYQLVGAFTETALTGRTRFDALAPEITWFDLSQSLAPEGVVRSAWAAVLYAGGAANIPEHIHRGFIYGVASGQWPQGDVPGIPDLDSRFSENGPSGFVDEDIRIDVPTLIGQGTNDNLFNLNEAWKNFERGLTDSARERSSVVAYNGGHALPNVLPPGQTDLSSDACSAEGGFADLRLQFFEAVRNGTGDARDIVGSPYSLTTADGDRCIAVDSLEDRTTLASGIDLGLSTADSGSLEIDRLEGADDRTVALGDESAIETDAETLADVFDGLDIESDIGPDTLGSKQLGAGLLGEEIPDSGGVGGLDTDAGGTVASPTGAGIPIHIELAEGELTVGGVPTASATVTSAGVEQRLFFALSVGETPATAQVVQNNMMPLREPEPVTGEERTVELPGVAVDVGPDESLFLTISAVSDMSFAHGSVRTPGAVVLEDLTVDVPVVE